MPRSTPQSSTRQKRGSSKDRPPDKLPAAAADSRSANDQPADQLRYVGLDVHKQQITYCILDGDGTVVREDEIVLTRERLADFARHKLRSTDRVALESTTNCWAVVDVLQPYVAQVVVSNPMATKAIAHSKIKTDKVDAKVLAQLLRCDFLPTVWQPDAATRQRRQLSGRRASLVGQRTQLRNRIHSVLAMRLLVPPAGTSLFGQLGLAWLKSLNEDVLDADGRMMIDSDLKLLDAVEAEIAAFDRRLAELAWQDERVKLLMTIPGISVVVAQALIAAFGDISRFRTPDQAASYLGLTPSTRQSANTTHHGPITKHGNSTARWMLVQAAQQYARQPGPLGHFFQRLKRRKCHNVAVVATARKLAMIAWRMLISGEPYRYAQPRSTEQKLARLRITVTGEKRRGGTPKGIKCEAKCPGGGRTVRSVDAVYQNEGLPTRPALTAGEQRTIQQTETTAFVQTISQARVIPRKQPTNKDQATATTGKQPAITRSPK